MNFQHKSWRINFIYNYQCLTYTQRINQVQIEILKNKKIEKKGILFYRPSRFLRSGNAFGNRSKMFSKNARLWLLGVDINASIVS